MIREIDTDIYENCEYKIVVPIPSPLYPSTHIPVPISQYPIFQSPYLSPYIPLILVKVHLVRWVVLYNRLGQLRGDGSYLYRMGASDSIYTGKSTFMVELLVRRGPSVASCCQVLTAIFSVSWAGDDLTLFCVSRKPQKS